MSLSESLEPKLDEIERLADEWYGIFLRTNGFTFDDDGAIVLIPSSPQNQPTLGGSLDQRDRDELERLMRENWRAFQDSVAELKERFRAFYDLVPLDYTVRAGMLGGQSGGAPVDDLPPTNIYERLTYAYERWVSRVDGMINQGQWSGDAARVFHEQFLFPFHGALERQRAFVIALGLTVQSYHDSIAEAHELLLGIADACIARLSGDVTGNESDLTVAGLASLVAGAIALYPPLGTAAGLISLGIGVPSFLAAELGSADDTPRQLQVTGSRATEIIESTWQAIVALEQRMGDLDETLWRGLNQDLASTQSFANPGLRLDRPDLADQRGSFGRLTIQSQPGVPLESNAVVASIVEIYEAGYVNLPGAAGQYDQAVADLYWCSLPGSLPRFYPRSVPAFYEAQDVLGGTLGSTRDSMIDAGHALVQVALGYELSDAETAEVMRQVGAFEPPSIEVETPRVGGV